MKETLIDAQSLLKELKKVFPNYLPTEEDITIREINVKQGEQKIIRFIEEKINDVSDP